MFTTTVVADFYYHLSREWRPKGPPKTLCAHSSVLPSTEHHCDPLTIATSYANVELLKFQNANNSILRSATIHEWAIPKFSLSRL